MVDQTELAFLRGRIAALELVTVVETLVSASRETDFNAKDFAERRKSFWAAIGSTLNDDGKSESIALQRSLNKLGNLLVMMSEPIQARMEKD